MLFISLVGNARERGDSTLNKKIEKKTETGQIYISEETSVYGKELIHNAKFSVIKKKNIKSRSKFLVQKKRVPAKAKQKTQIKKINYYDDIISNNDSNKELQAISHQKTQCIVLPQHYIPDIEAFYTIIQKLFFSEKLLPSSYNHAPIENSKMIILSIRPPPKESFQ
ncbi:hypothetical protein B0A69_15445 [Chryseobacterium shigense]|nr:hypothetical protein B0A69_15445 [Chryseobacterium shigense]